MKSLRALFFSLTVCLSTCAQSSLADEYTTFCNGGYSGGYADPIIDVPSPVVAPIDTTSAAAVAPVTAAATPVAVPQFVTTHQVVDSIVLPNALNLGVDCSLQTTAVVDFVNGSFDPGSTAVTTAPLGPARAAGLVDLPTPATANAVAFDTPAAMAVSVAEIPAMARQFVSAQLAIINNPARNDSPSNRPVAAVSNDFSRLAVSINQGNANFLLFNNVSQALAGGNARITAVPGTLVSRAQNTITLHAGTMLAQTGDKELEIVTHGARVQLPEHSVALVKVAEKHPLKILAVHASRAIKVLDTKGIEPENQLESGEELVMADSAIEEADLIPCDGMGCIPISGGIEKQSHVIKARVISLANRGSRHALARAGKFVRLSPSATQDQETVARVDLVEAGFETVAGVAGPLQIVATKGTEFQQENATTTRIKHGTAIVNAQTATELQLPIGSVKLSPDAIAMVEAANGVSRIKSLHGMGEIVVVAGKHYAKLNAGDEMVISDHHIEASERHPADRIARRLRTSSLEMDGVHVAMNDFSIVSQLRIKGCYQTLKNMDDGKTLNKILKAAVAVEVAKQKRGKYEPASATQNVAMNK